MLLNKTMPFRDFLRTIIFTPYVMPIVSTALIFSFIYHPDVGVLNAALGVFGIPKINWLNAMDARGVDFAAMEREFFATARPEPGSFTG